MIIPRNATLNNVACVDWVSSNAQVQGCTATTWCLSVCQLFVQLQLTSLDALPTWRSGARRTRMRTCSRRTGRTRGRRTRMRTRSRRTRRLNGLHRHSRSDLQRVRHLRSKGRDGPGSPVGPLHCQRLKKKHEGPSWRKGLKTRSCESHLTRHSKVGQRILQRCTNKLWLYLLGVTAICTGTKQGLLGVDGTH